MTGGRGSGKTYASMTQIHDLIIAGERPNICIVFPNKDSVQWWYEAWNQRFPHIPMPTYTTVHNTLNTRGRRWRYVYVTDASAIDGGWRNDKLWQTVLVDLTPDAEIVYIYDMNPWDPSINAHTWSQYPPDVPLEPAVVRGGFLRRYLKRAKPE